MSYLYADNVSPADRFTQVEIQSDDGNGILLERGLRYDLSATELARASRFVAMQYSPLPASAAPSGIYQLSVKGNPVDGDVPVWDSGVNSFVPAAFAASEIGALPSGVVGGSNLVPNPSFHDGVTGYTSAGAALAADGLLGLFGAGCARLTRSLGTGQISIVSSVVTVRPRASYSASAWVRLGLLGTSSARLVTASIKWYDAADALITTSAASGSEPIDGSWARVSVAGAVAPDTAAKATVQVAIDAVPQDEYHLVDAVQLEVGNVPTSFGLDMPTSSLTGQMMTPATLTTREISVALIDDIVALVEAGMSGSTSGIFDLPITLDPRLGSGYRTFTANNLYFFRVQGAGTINGLGFHAGTGDATATAYLGVYANAGSARNARPAAWRASATVSPAGMSGAGFKSATFAAPVSVSHGDWFALGFSTSTPAVLTSAPNITSVITDGFAHFQSGILPTMPDPAGTLFSYLSSAVIVGT